MVAYCSLLDCLLLAGGLLTSRHMFPGWEHFIPNVGKIATFNASNCYL